MIVPAFAVRARHCSGSNFIVSKSGRRVMMNFAVWSPAAYSNASLPEIGFDGCGTSPKFEPWNSRAVEQRPLRERVHAGHGESRRVVGGDAFHRRELRVGETGHRPCPLRSAQRSVATSKVALHAATSR